VRRVLTLALGILIGQWLAFGSAISPAEYAVRAERAWRGADYLEAMQFWTHAVALQPADPIFQYRRGTALARLGLSASALDAFQTALLLEPSPDLTRRILEDIARLTGATGSGTRETTVPLEPTLGVWTTRVMLNGVHAGRFLVDTGSSVTVVSPRLAGAVGIGQAAGGPPVELQTLGGRTTGPSAIVDSLRVGDLELREAPVVVHEPGPGVDGILGNSFLGRYRVTVDADRRQLHLRLLGRD
jgi:clan AA aspartic protease (TIGR02281 family)